MAELSINKKYYNRLYVEGFSQMMKSPSYCYKFYWLEAIVQLISENKKEATYNEIIDEMIANAWYSVLEFYVHLSGIFVDGQVKDNLEKAICKLFELSGLNRKLTFNEEWIQMIEDNAVSILGWIQLEKVKWFQNNNPEIPGLVYKLEPMDEKMRKLTRVRALWEKILELCQVKDVFKDEPIEKESYDVDHFIPWSFVMNDELWNLMPMDSRLNSSKSNRLPDWEPFFKRFAFNQYIMYELIYEKEIIRKLYEACFRDNLHSIWANQELYRKGNTKEEFYSILDKNMRPVYDSARRQGYEIWNQSIY